MYQLVNIPATATAATLSFWYNITTQASSTVTAGVLNVTIQSATASYLATVAVRSNVPVQPAGIYEQVVFDLTGFKGQTVRIHFNATTTATLPTTFRIDDVSLKYTVPATPLPPIATTVICQVNGPSSALLAGSVNPNGSPSTAWFNWGLTTAYGNSTSPQNIGNATTSQQVAATIPNLLPSKTYHFRMVGQNSGGTSIGDDLTCDTPAPPVSLPTVTTDPAINVGTSSATLTGTVNPNGAPFTTWFEWGLTTAYGNESQHISSGNTGHNPVPMSWIVPGLSPNTMYHFRIVAQNSAGINRGSDRSFLTTGSSGPPVVNCTGSGTPLQTAINNAANGSTILVTGTCNENVFFGAAQTGITLNGQNSSTIIGGPNLNSATIAVRGRGITIKGFTIRGGFDGIVVWRGATALIDGNLIENARFNGIEVSIVSHATIINNTIQNNPSAGIAVSSNASARIGFILDSDTFARGNTIQNNGSNGIHIFRSSTARVVGNLISNNGDDGIDVDGVSHADISGNAISGNAADAIDVSENSGVNLGNASGNSIFDLPNTTTTNNGVFGIQCSINSYVSGRIGTLNGNSAPKSIGGNCFDNFETALVATPSVLDFNVVQVGTSKDIPFTVRNSGGGTLDGTVTTSSPFSILGDNGFSLAANLSKTFTVRFLPTAASAFQGTVSIVSNSGSASIDVLGSGDACSANGSLAGVVRDAATGLAAAGAFVTLSNGTSTFSSGTGAFSFSGLTPGGYAVDVSVAGYLAYHQNVLVCGNTTQNILLTKSATVLGLQTPSGYSADPVNTATGNYTYLRRDLALPGKGMGFGLERTYNSQDAQPGPLGFGWNHRLNTSLTVDAGGNVTIRWGDGKTETFSPNGLGGFVPQYGVFDTLIKNADGTYTVKKKDLTSYNFNVSYRLAAIVDKNGNTINLVYTGQNLTQVIDTVGRTTNFAYDGSGRITIITDPLGRTVQFAYDLSGDLVSATDMRGNTTLYTYDANHQILTVTDPRSNVVVTNVYDALKRVVASQRDAKGGQIVYTYDDINRITVITDPLGQNTIHFHDELLRLIQQTDPGGNSTFYTYDAAGNRTAVTDKNANTTIYAYDARGNVLTKTDPLNNLTTITYDANNNPLSRTDPLNKTTVFAYDAKSNLLSALDPLGVTTSYIYDPNGLLLSATDSRGNTTNNNYDLQGNMIRVTDALGNRTDYSYDGVGRRLTTTDALGKISQFSYDANNNLLSTTDPLGAVTSYSYDANNNRTSVTDPLGKTTSFAYDVKDLLTTTTDPLGKTQTVSYDALDRKIATQDKNGNTASYAYDPVGNLTQVTDALGKFTSFTYDANGNRLTTTDPNGNVSTATYDKLNRLVAQTDPLLNAATTIFDSAGRVISSTNAKGQTTGFAYDALGRLLQVTDANGGVVRYTYDANGNRLSMTDPNGKVMTYAYDPLNRLVTKTEPLGTSTSYVYDAVGNRTRLTDPSGNIVNYTYDAARRLKTIAYPDSTSVTFSYDLNGNRTQMIDSLGTSSYAYDALNRLTSHTNAFGKTVGYGYDNNGNRTTLTYPDAKVVTYGYNALNRLASVKDWQNRTTTYTYDNASRLTNAVNPNSTSASYSYDNSSRLVSLTNTKSDASVIASYAYTLDKLGNHTQANVNEPLLPNFSSQAISYAYDAENRLTNVSGVANTFDLNGNMTARGGDIFSFDFQDRLIQTDVGGLTTQYQYDGAGNRLARIDAAGSKRFVLDINGRLSNVLAETNQSGSITAYYVYGLGLISKVLPDGTATYFHYDSRGSTVALTDASQVITDAYAYDPFGKLANTSGATANPFKYVGRYGLMDEGNSVSYVRARYYDSKLGRFLTKDPLTGNDEDGQSLNRYVYALNRPVILVDASGLTPQSFSSDLYHRFILDCGTECASKLTKKVGEMFLSNYAWTKVTDWYVESLIQNNPSWDVGGLSLTTQSALKTLNFLKLADIVMKGKHEFNNRGYTTSDLKSAAKNISDIFAFVKENPGAVLDSLEEGVTSTTAVVINSLTGNAFDLSGQDVQKLIEKPANWIGDKLYQGYSLLKSIF